MPHIHAESGQADFTVGVFIVCGDRVMYRLHDKFNKWLVPGGHIELDEVPEQSALREVYEEVGLEVELYNPNNLSLVSRTEDATQVGAEDYRELLVPSFMDVHPIVAGSSHRHINFTFFAKSKTMEVVEPEGVEKSGGIIWLNKEEIAAHPDIAPIMKNYGLMALAVLGE